MVSPYCFPPYVPSRADPSGLGHAATIYSSVQGPPGVETPTHLNPNSILQVSVFVHLCEAFLGILPHFSLWKYLYHCRPGMAGGQHQLVGARVWRCVVGERPTTSTSHSRTASKDGAWSGLSWRTMGIPSPTVR
jgi:hypothetical protein